MAKKTEEKIEDNQEFEDFRVGDAIYRTKISQMQKDRKPYKVPNPKESLAFIPGTIVEINVKKGDQVKQGEIMMLLEAMKMKNHVKAPFDGVVKNIYVKVGQIVSKNYKMIELK